MTETGELLPGIGVVVLAAGAGRRLGQGPKAHVPLGEETFLSRVIRCCREAGLGPIWVVGSGDDPCIGPVCAELGAHLVRNPQPERGMSSSAWLGLAATRESGLLGVLVFPVDLPLVAASTAGAVARELGRGANVGARVLVRPVFGATHGHPIGLSAALAQEIVALGVPSSLREVLAALSPTRVDVPCDDRAILTDIDLPSDLTSALSRGA
jgi:CTP:molybdopterin cytidylyltransferase MocA